MVGIIQSVDRAISLLDAIAESGDEGVALSTLARHVGLIPSTAYRILATLVRRDYAVKDETSRRYFPGPALRIRGGGSELSLLHQKARPYLSDLARASGETINLALLRPNGVVFVDQIVSDQLVRVVPKLGAALPFYATAAGKALLAAMPPALVMQYVGRGPLVACTEHTIRSRDALEANLKQIRRIGYATDDEELAPGGRCVAAAVRKGNGHAIAALSISGPADRMPRKRLRALGELVRHAALSLSRDIANAVSLPTDAQGDIAGTSRPRSP